MMMLSRVISWKLLKQSQYCLSNAALVSSNQRRFLSTTKENDDSSNEWLWTYLRDRKGFTDLNEEQRRRVIEIG